VQLTQKCAKFALIVTVRAGAQADISAYVVCNVINNYLAVFLIIAQFSKMKLLTIFHMDVTMPFVKLKLRVLLIFIRR
jgi:hypothetical protein